MGRHESSEANTRLSERIQKVEDKFQTAGKSAKDQALNLLQGAAPAKPQANTCAAGEGHCTKTAFGYAGAVKSCDCKISGGFCSPFALTTHWAFFAELWIWNFWKVNCEDFITPGDSSSASSFLEVERKPVRHSKKHAGLSKAHHMLEKQDVSLMLEREEEEEKKAYWFDWFKNPKVKDNMPEMTCAAWDSWTSFHMGYWLKWKWNMVLDCLYMNGETAQCPWTKAIADYFAFEIKSTVGFGEISWGSTGGADDYDFCTNPSIAVEEARLKAFDSLWFLDLVLDAFS